ncbi:MAG TPA: DNA internalization-related competence protein ComEC/Rec2 [Candidatus Baltobacteraceae bacterium]|jgi:competence protein ComEC|nr:DNA internalization-related competence protein ComEC/Rec2 [Candidatus Baltobacteraceae bacterium]
MMFAAILFAWFHSGALPPGPFGHTARIACSVIDVTPSQLPGESEFTCETDDGAMLAVAARGMQPTAGTHLLVRGRFELFDGPRNPGEPDQRAIERERGIDGRLEGATILAALPSAPITPRIALAKVHAWAGDQLHARMSEPYASILAGELWGARGSLPPELHTEFQETGTVHILVTAGLHLGVVALLTLSLLRTCSVPRAWTCASAIAAVWIYAIFSGLHLPSLRAAIMASFALTARACGLAPLSWRAFAAAAFGVAVMQPYALGGASFALSFSCVGAIFLCADEILDFLEHFALPERVKEALTLTIATQLGTWPLTASIFLLFAPYAVIANLCVVPVVGITMLLGGVQLLLFAFPGIAQGIANVNSWILAWIVACVHTIATLPGASVPMTPPPAWTIAFYDACLALAVWCTRRKAASPAIAAVFIGITTAVAPPVFTHHRLRITILDVGQADGIVIQTPRGHTIVVDAGGRLERGGGTQSTAEQAGERVVVPFLRRAGVRRIDALILSHPHGDHAGGMAPILRAFDVHEFADSGQQYGGYAYNDALGTARYEHVPIVYPRAGMVWRTNDGVVLTFIGPSLPFIESDNTINDNSVAFVLQYKHFRMLFTGDAGVSAEQRFLNEGLDLRADVLKVGHHGSAYSSSPAFIAAVHPHFAIVSVGRHNMFGHPAPSTIATLQRAGAQVFRTDENGASFITTDGLSMVIQSMLPSQRDHAENSQDDTRG